MRPIDLFQGPRGLEWTILPLLKKMIFFFRNIVDFKEMNDFLYEYSRFNQNEYLF